jgi:hypothetical protein
LSRFCRFCSSRIAYHVTACDGRGSKVREGGRGRTHHEEEEEADDEPDEAALVPLGRVVAHLVPLLVPVPFLGAHARARALARVGEGDKQERL